MAFTSKVAGPFLFLLIRLACVSMPVALGRNGIEQIFDILLNDNERACLKQSAAVIRAMCDQPD